MKKFKFKFDSVEKVRQIKEKETHRELAKTQDLLRTFRTHKETLIQDLKQALIRRENLGKDPISVVVFQTEEDFIRGTKQRIIQADQAILRASRSVEKAMKKFLEARRQLRMLEVLREKEKAHHRDERRKYEQKNLDDLYTMRFRLRQGEWS